MADLFSEQCEGAGRPAGWNQYQDGGGGSSDWDYATSPAPLAGSQSLRMSCPASPAWQVEYFTFAEKSRIDLYLMFRFTTLPSGVKSDILHLDNGVPTQFLGVSVSSTGKLYSYGAAISGGDTTYSISANVTYHLWLEYHYNGAWKMWISTDSTKPGTPAWSETASGSYNVGLVALICDPNVVEIFDNMLCRDSEIGSNPFGGGGLGIPPHVLKPNRAFDHLLVR